MIHVVVMDSFMSLFRGGKPLEVIEIWFPVAQCLFSTHINYNQNQKWPRFAVHVHSYMFCLLCFFNVYSTWFVVFFGFRSLGLCEPWHFQHLINTFMHIQYSHTQRCIY